ncbi:helix-turn-helix domain-containing protein [Microcoleus sp. herbarium7]
MTPASSGQTAIVGTERGLAIACGFSHQSHLNRHFKRLTGVTPKTWNEL